MVGREPVKRVILTVYCRLSDHGELYETTRPLVEEGVRVGVELASCREDGAFSSLVKACERPMFNRDEGELELWVVVPESYLPHFSTASSCKLKAGGAYEVASCEIRNATIVDV